MSYIGTHLPEMFVWWTLGWLAAASVAILLIWGASDGIVTTDYGASLRDLIPGARMSVIPDAGHHPHVEQPSEFIRRFLEFASS